jgi:hypothetical protein
MKLRFSLRTLLLCTIAAAAAAAFVALRLQPARVAQEFQAAVRQGDWNAAVAMMGTVDIKRKLGPPDAHTWELKSFEFRPQSAAQWLRGECRGELAVTSRSSSESNDAYWSVIETSHCDIAITARGVQIVSFTKEEPLVAGVPKLHDEVDESDPPPRN